MRSLASFRNEVIARIGVKQARARERLVGNEEQIIFAMRIEEARRAQRIIAAAGTPVWTEFPYLNAVRIAVNAQAAAAQAQAWASTADAMIAIDVAAFEATQAVRQADDLAEIAAAMATFRAALHA